MTKKLECEFCGQEPPEDPKNINYEEGDDCPNCLGGGELVYVGKTRI